MSDCFKSRVTRLLSASAICAFTIFTATPALAKCTLSGSSAICDTSVPNPEPDGAVGTNIRVLSGAQVTLNDPFAFASVRYDTVILNAGGNLTTEAGSRISETITGGRAVVAGANSTVDVAGAVAAEAYQNSVAVDLSQGATLMVRQGGIVDGAFNAVQISGSGTRLQIDGKIRNSSTSGSAIAMTATDFFLNTTTYSSTITVGSTGEIFSANTPAIALSGGSQLTVAGTITAQTGAAAILYGTGPGSVAVINIQQGGTIEAQSGTAIKGNGTAVNLTIAGNVFGGPGQAAVSLGNGDDRVTLTDTARTNGVIDAGGGRDILATNFATGASAPGELNLGSFTGFETFDAQAGTVAVSGNGAFQTISVSGGRLIGRAGSALSGNVNVSAGAIFGSAGTVNGNIAVAGILSPGASPGTMTVNGNVALSAGSTTLFEFTPTVSDKLIINGSLAIANGASLQLTGNRPLMPGVYTLVSATGGINGTFGTNVTRDATVLGYLSYTTNTIELLSTFQLGAGASTQVSLTTAYLNSLLIGGTATSGILAAVPALIGTDGFANQAALSTLHPEAYASAVQMGIENGLSIASTLRSVHIARGQEEAGIFVFGQGYGNWRDFSGDARGVSRANVRQSGFLGGVGLGNQTIAASLFVGRSDSNQRIGGIGATNHSDGVFFGGKVQFGIEGIEAGASFIFDRATADTTRHPTTGVAATSSNYGLHGTTADGYLGYGFAVGGGWKIGPQFGITYVSVKRDAVSEVGGGAFALNVAAQRYDATFLSGDLKFSTAGDGSFRPWVTAGLRYEAGGDAIVATGTFVGAATAFTVDGARRERTAGHLALGFDVMVAHNLEFFADGDAVFSGGNGSRRVAGGLRLTF